MKRFKEININFDMANAVKNSDGYFIDIVGEFSIFENPTAFVFHLIEANENRRIELGHTKEYMYVSIDHAINDRDIKNAARIENLAETKSEEEDAWDNNGAGGDQQI